MEVQTLENNDTSTPFLIKTIVKFSKSIRVIDASLCVEWFFNLRVLFTVKFSDSSIRINKTSFNWKRIEICSLN